MTLPNPDILNAALSKAQIVITSAQEAQKVSEEKELQNTIAENESRQNEIEDILKKTDLYEAEIALAMMKSKGLQVTEEYQTLKSELINFYQGLGLDLPENLLEEAN